MPDKNLRDNEILKALEICSTYKGKCTDCPAFVKVDHSKCKQVLVGAIEIINHQNEEIERLKSRKSVIRKDLRCDSVDDILNGTFSIESENCVACDIEEIKAEARKEFCEKRGIKYVEDDV